MSFNYWVDQAKPAEANNYACADCSRRGVPVMADKIVDIKGTIYAFCNICSKNINENDEYIEWLNRNKPKHMKKVVWTTDPRLKFSDDDNLTDHICPACFEEGNIEKAVIVFHSNIPMCRKCYDYFELQDNYLTPYERGGLDNYYASLRISLHNHGCHRTFLE